MILVRHQNNIRSVDGGGPYFDPLLLVTFLLLIVFGMIAVYSATIAHAFSANNPFFYLRRSGVHILFALTAMLIFSRIPVRLWQHLAPVSLITGIALLILVLIPSIGVKLNGGMRWVEVAGLRFQPSEFAELAFLIFVADYLVTRRGYMQDFMRDVVPILVIFIVFATLLLAEPDFGSTVVLGSVLILMLILSGMRWRHTVTVTGAALLGMAALILAKSYRLERFISFIDPFGDPYDTGFQLVQSLIAFGRGEWFGVGIGNSVQKLDYLPLAGSDFLLAIIAEEMGFLGICTVIVLFVVLIWRIFHVSWSAGAAGDTFGMLLAQAIGALIAVSALVNMGVNMGLLPTKGLTLPFMSEGGTSLIVYSAALGMIFSIERSSRQESEQ